MNRESTRDRLTLYVVLTCIQDLRNTELCDVGLIEVKKVLFYKDLGWFERDVVFEYRACVFKMVINKNIFVCEMSILLLLFLVFCAGLFLLFAINFKWCVKIVREIAREGSGYTKLIQLVMMFMLVSIFVVIIIYYLYNPERVDRIDIILTVVVGWLGAIIGMFFGEKSMSVLEERRADKVEHFIQLFDEEKKVTAKLQEEVRKYLK